MAKLGKEKLFDVVITSIRNCGWQVVLLSKIDQHPLRFKMFKDEEGYLVRAYIWNITHGGGALRPADEFRIQITGVNQFTPETDGKTVILGWWDEAGVFAGFDFRFHNQPLGASPSFQIKEECLRQAYEKGFCPYKKENQEIAIAFRPDFIVEYIRSLESLHNFGQTDRDFEILSSVAINPSAVSDEQVAMVSEPRRITVASVRRALRDNSFKNRVLNAYSHKCAVCGLQLDLVEAAHIVPVAHPNSTDETSNGITLCALHHKAYDKALITVNEQYRVLASETKMNYLLEIGHEEGKESFLENLRPFIILPPAERDRANPEYLKIGMEIRGWQT